MASTIRFVSTTALTVALAASVGCRASVRGSAGAGGGPPPAAEEPPPPTPVEAPPPARASWDKTGWVLLGETWVQGKTDRDVIPVGKAEGKFTKLMLVVEESELEMHDMTITFGQGGKFSPPVKHFFRENDRTRAIDLPGNARFIKKIEFTYGNLPGGGRAKVEVWAREGGGPMGAGAGPAPAGPPPGAGPGRATPAQWDRAGWVMLGEKVVNGKNDTDVIQVGKKEGKFTRLMVVVEDSELEMRDVVVEFGQGGKFSPEMKHFFRENDRTRAIDLPGDKRFIKKIKFKYSNLPGGGRARVQVWAKEG